MNLHHRHDMLLMSFAMSSWGGSHRPKEVTWKLSPPNGEPLKYMYMYWSACQNFNLNQDIVHNIPLGFKILLYFYKAKKLKKKWRNQTFLTYYLVMFKVKETIRYMHILYGLCWWFPMGTVLLRKNKSEQTSSFLRTRMLLFYLLRVLS